MASNFKSTKHGNFIGNVEIALKFHHFKYWYDLVFKLLLVLIYWQLMDWILFESPCALHTEDQELSVWPMFWHIRTLNNKKRHSLFLTWSASEENSFGYTADLSDLGREELPSSLLCVCCACWVSKLGNGGRVTTKHDPVSRPVGWSVLSRLQDVLVCCVSLVWGQCECDVDSMLGIFSAANWNPPEHW